MNRWQTMLVLVMLGLSGCSLPEQKADFRSDVECERIDALARAARAGDRSHDKDIVEMLDSSDPAVRMLASRTLSDLAGGETFGYRYAAPGPERQAAIQKWVAWANAGGPRSSGKGG